MTLNDGDVDVTGCVNLRERSDGTAGTIKTFNAAGNAGPEIRPVYVNGETNQTPGDHGTAHTINVGQSVYAIPTASSQVAQILPGLHEDLSPVPAGTAQFAIGDVFEAVDNGTFVNGVVPGRTSTLNVAAENTLNAGDNSIVLVDSGNQDTLNTAWNRVSSTTRLFFVAGTVATNSEGTVTNSQVYQIVYYDNSTHTITFSLVGSGNIVISSATLTIGSPSVNVTGIGTTNPGTGESIVFSSDEGGLFRSTLNTIAGAQSTLTAEVDSNPTTRGTISEIDYEGNHNVDFQGGRLLVNLTGKYNLNPAGETERTAAFDTAPFGLYLLGGTTVGTTTTVRLHSASVGDSVKIVNLSTVGTDGVARASGNWQLMPFQDQKIMKLPDNEMMVLDDPSANFEIVYTGSNAGWVLMGTN